MFRDTKPTGDSVLHSSMHAAEHPPRRDRAEGHVVKCDGNMAVIHATTPAELQTSDDYWSVGSLITIRANGTRSVGMVYRIEAAETKWSPHDKNPIQVHVELVGEIRDDANRRPVFAGGLSAYPYLGAIAHRIRNADLKAIFANTEASAMSAGQLSQNPDVEAMLSIDALVARHFAVVGTTGVGKSTAVSLLVRKIVAMRPDTGVLLLDPHDEFATAFADISVTINPANLDLPFWVFRLEELVEVLFRGRRSDPDEVDILRDFIPIAKERFQSGGSTTVRRQRGVGMTADTPLPYRISDLLALIDEKAGQLDSRDTRSALKSLSARINATIHDPRYRFMFANRTITDNLSDVLAHIYRVPHAGKPISIFQLNGIPSEVVNAVVSVLCRLAFDLSVGSHGRVRTLVLCEEAHRYIPAQTDAGFGPTRAAIARIAKEGRKYGVSLGIITQRPSELDPTILSQCNTVFAMRLGNNADQDIMRKAITGASRSYINFLPSLSNREAIAFGQAVSTPMRMMFENVDSSQLPGHHLHSHKKASQTDMPIDISTLVRAMRDTAPDTTRSAEDLDSAGPSIPGQPVGTQPPSIHTTAALDQAKSALDDMFTYEGPLRRSDDAKSDATQTAPRPSGRDLISRFRR